MAHKPLTSWTKSEKEDEVWGQNATVPFRGMLQGPEDLSLGLTS
jgi:hypothetical protein